MEAQNEPTTTKPTTRRSRQPDLGQPEPADPDAVSDKRTLTSFPSPPTARGTVFPPRIPGLHRQHKLPPHRAIRRLPRRSGPLRVDSRDGGLVSANPRVPRRHWGVRGARGILRGGWDPWHSANNENGRRDGVRGRMSIFPTPTRSSHHPPRRSSVGLTFRRRAPLGPGAGHWGGGRRAGRTTRLAGLLCSHIPGAAARRPPLVAGPTGDVDEAVTGDSARGRDSGLEPRQIRPCGRTRRPYHYQPATTRCGGVPGAGDAWPRTSGRRQPARRVRGPPGHLRVPMSPVAGPADVSYVVRRVRRFLPFPASSSGSPRPAAGGAPNLLWFMEPASTRGAPRRREAVPPFEDVNRPPTREDFEPQLLQRGVQTSAGELAAPLQIASTTCLWGNDFPASRGTWGRTPGKWLRTTFHDIPGGRDAAG